MDLEKLQKQDRNDDARRLLQKNSSKARTEDYSTSQRTDVEESFIESFFITILLIFYSVHVCVSVFIPSLFLYFIQVHPYLWLIIIEKFSP